MALFLSKIGHMKKHYMNNIELVYALTLATDIKGVEIILTPIQTNSMYGSSLQNQFIVGSESNPYQIQLVESRNGKVKRECI